MFDAPRGRIFISYRRQEAAWPARQLYAELSETFGAEQVFKDVDNINPGDDFVQRISDAVASCDILLALIGRQWVTITDDTGQRRIDDPADFVRIEVASALARSVRVIPILLDGTPMPRAADLPDDLAPLARRQAVPLDPVSFDTSRLFATIQGILSRPADQAATVVPPAVPGLAATTIPLPADAAAGSTQGRTPDETTPEEPTVAEPTVAEPMVAEPTAVVPTPEEPTGAFVPLPADPAGGATPPVGSEASSGAAALATPIPTPADSKSAASVLPEQAPAEPPRMAERGGPALSVSGAGARPAAPPSSGTDARPAASPPSDQSGRRRPMLLVAAAVGLAVAVGLAAIWWPRSSGSAGSSGSGGPVVTTSRPSTSASGATGSPSAEPTQSAAQPPTTGPFAILAHRGGQERHQLETQEAMEDAAREGFSVETDLRRTADGVFVLVHDEQATKGLACGGRDVRVSQTTFADLQKWCRSKPTATDKFSYRIPTYSAAMEAIAAASPTAWVFVEVKWDATKTELRKILDVLINNGLRERAVITSFEASRLAAVRAVDPAFPTMLFVSGTAIKPTGIAKGTTAVAVQFPLLSAGYVDSLQDRGLKVVGWLLNDEAMWAKAQQWGVDGMLTDYPVKCAEWLTQHA